MKNPMVYITSLRRGVKLKSFDDYLPCLGDIMRGERATLGNKSLHDVERDLCIRICYIEAIENGDLSAFGNSPFLSGYVRAYARYLGMDPDKTLQAFYRENGLDLNSQEPSSGMGIGRNWFANEVYPRYVQSYENPHQAIKKRLAKGFLEPEKTEIPFRAFWSIAVLIGLVLIFGFGVWTLLKEVQRVQVTSVDQGSFQLLDIDPLRPSVAESEQAEPVVNPLRASSRSFSPQSLDVPVLVARDGPISALNPETVGVFADGIDQQPDDGQGHLEIFDERADVVQVVADDVEPYLRMVAVRPAWLRITSAEGDIIEEGVFDRGQSYDVSVNGAAPRVRIRESGAVYFDHSGTFFGPVGSTGAVTDRFVMSLESVTNNLPEADVDADDDLNRIVNLSQDLSIGSADEADIYSIIPAVRVDETVRDVQQSSHQKSETLRLVAVRPAWIRVTSPNGTSVFEGILEAGQSYDVSTADESLVARVGESGSVYFDIGGVFYGPVGERGTVTKNITLSFDYVTRNFVLGDVEIDKDLRRLTLSGGRVSSERVALSSDAAKAKSVSDRNLRILPQVYETEGPKLYLIAARPAWVRVTSANRSIIFESFMKRGQIYEVPATEEPSVLRTGNAGGVYFLIDEQYYGPVGNDNEILSNFVLSTASIQQTMSVADLRVHNDLAQIVAEAQLGAAIPVR